MTSKISDFLRTFQHHEDFSLYSIDEVRLNIYLTTTSNHKKSHTCCVVLYKDNSSSTITKEDQQQQVYLWHRRRVRCASVSKIREDYQGKFVSHLITFYRTNNTRFTFYLFSLQTFRIQFDFSLILRCDCFKFFLVGMKISRKTFRRTIGALFKFLTLDPKALVVLEVELSVACVCGVITFQQNRNFRERKLSRSAGGYGWVGFSKNFKAWKHGEYKAERKSSLGVSFQPYGHVSRDLSQIERKITVQMKVKAF